jgi:hypothetical protein
MVGGVQSYKLGFDFKTQTAADITGWVRGIFMGETEQQVRMGNPPTITTVDNSTGKSPLQAKAKVVAIFGTTLPMAAMRLVENELAAAIRRSTSTLTGALSNVGGNWQWLHLTADGKVQPVQGGRLVTFGPGDALILRPAPGRIVDKNGRGYAWMVNTWVASGFRGRGIESKGLLTTASGLSTSKPRKGRPPKKPPQRIGFMLAAVQNIRRKGEFRQFHIKVSFGRWDNSAINLSRIGAGPLTPSIIIRPRVSTRRG